MGYKEPLRDHQVRIFIHTGALSVDNGAMGPLGTFFSLADQQGVTKEVGEHYYDDSIVVDEKLLPVVTDILTEARMLFKIQGQDDEWRNVLTPEVAKALRLN